jgi:hypothetical protein
VWHVWCEADQVFMYRWRVREHQAVWITPEDLRKEGILISNHMMFDHFPDAVTVVLQSVIDKMHEDDDNASVQ